MKYDAGSKFFDVPITDFEPKNLRQLSESGFSGDYSALVTLYAAMEQNWDALQKDVATMINSISTLEYKVVPYSKEGEKPTPEAEAVAEVVSNAIWRKSEQVPGAWSQNFTQMVGSLYYGLLRGVHVVELYWAYEDGLVFPQMYRPVLPYFYAWETQEGKPDRLLLYPEGNGTGEGREFDRDKFIVAMNASTPDHPMYNAVMRSLVFPFGMYKWGGAWMMEHANIYGKPIRLFRVNSDEDKAKLERELASKPVLQDFVYVGDKDDVQVLAGAASGAILPQKELMEFAERACHKVILGQTLTSDTSEHGGSLAQAKVHAGVQAEASLAGGNYVCNVMNAQLVPAIVRKNYGGGTNGVPLPEIRCYMPGEARNAAKIEYHKGLKELGMPLRMDLLCDEYGLPQPQDGELVLLDGRVQYYRDPDKDSAAAPASAPAGLQRGKPAGDGRADDRPAPDDGGKPADDTNAAKAKDAPGDWRDMELNELLGEVYRKWSAPTVEKLRKAVEGGKSPAQIRRMITEGKLQPDTGALAALFAVETLGGVAAGKKGKE